MEDADEISSDTQIQENDQPTFIEDAFDQVSEASTRNERKGFLAGPDYRAFIVSKKSPCP